MAISGLNNIPYGTTMRLEKNPHEALRTIVSDGKVDAAFARTDSSFISDIRDDRVKNYCKSGLAPSAEWKAHELGGFDSANQSLFTDEKGRVVLRSKIEDQGDTLRHLINAPFDKASGEVSVNQSSEGFNVIAAKPADHKVVFHIPV
jgi:hypothetical protein